MFHTFTLSSGAVTPKEFVLFWMKFYKGFNTDAYKSVMNKHTLKKADLKTLFLWKNNMREGLTKKKERFLEEIGKEIRTINKLRREFDDAHFKKTFKDRGATWILTLRHVIDPNGSPIYDQHVYRSYKYLTDGIIVERDEIPKGKKVTAAYDNYKDFFYRFKHDAGCEAKQTDEALWAFGKFLSQYGKMMHP